MTTQGRGMIEKDGAPAFDKWLTQMSFKWIKKPHTHIIKSTVPPTRTFSLSPPSSFGPPSPPSNWNKISQVYVFVTTQYTYDRSPNNPTERSRSATESHLLMGFGTRFDRTMMEFASSWTYRTHQSQNLHLFYHSYHICMLVKTSLLPPGSFWGHHVLLYSSTTDPAVTSMIKPSGPTLPVIMLSLIYIPNPISCGSYNI